MFVLSTDSKSSRFPISGPSNMGPVHDKDIYPNNMGDEIIRVDCDASWNNLLHFHRTLEIFIYITWYIHLNSTLS